MSAARILYQGYTQRIVRAGVNVREENQTTCHIVPLSGMRLTLIYHRYVGNVAQQTHCRECKFQNFAEHSRAGRGH